MHSDFFNLWGPLEIGGPIRAPNAPVPKRARSASHTALRQFLMMIVVVVIRFYGLGLVPVPIQNYF